MGKRKKRIDYRFRYQPLVGSLDDVVLDYARSHLQSSTINDPLLAAIRAFWLFDACSSTGDYSQDYLCQLGLESIEALESQARKLRFKLGLQEIGTAPAPVMISNLHASEVPAQVQQELTPAQKLQNTLPPGKKFAECF